MKVMTKQWVKDYDFLDLITTLEPNSGKRVPFVFTNGGTECVAKEDLYTVKTDFNLTEKDNEINFIMLPEVFDLEVNFFGDGNKINEKTCKNDFLIQYLDNLRIISYLPDNLLKLVKDKRLLALGYAEKEVKKEILKYIKSKYRKAIDEYDKCNIASANAETELTIHGQFKNNFFAHSVPFMFDGANISKVKTVKDKIYLTINGFKNIVFTAAEIIEQEVDIVNSWVNAIELYKKESRYELHFLVNKRDENSVSHYYYVTYAFKDLKFVDE